MLSLVNDADIIITGMHHSPIFCQSHTRCTDLILQPRPTHLISTSRMTAYTGLGDNLVLCKNLAHILVGGCLANGIGADVNEMIQLFKLSHSTPKSLFEEIHAFISQRWMIVNTCGPCFDDIKILIEYPFIDSM